jgi:hypothetical protein
MPLELIGAGFGRTGTLSLKTAIETLGLPCHHMLEVFANPGSEKQWYDASLGKQTDWEGLLGSYRAIVDWPGCRFWQELTALYPDAPVLLSVRDSERWYESAYETIYQAIVGARSSEDPEVLERMKMADKIVFEDTFKGRFEDRAFAMGVFEAHIEEVKRSIPSDRLLVYAMGGGWEPLCRVLGKPVPDVDFPHVNSRDEFLGRVKSAADNS